MMNIEKKTIRSDIPGHHTYLSGHSYAASDDAARLIVGRGIRLQGSVSSCDHLIVEGQIDAADLTARRLDIIDSGVFSGAAQVTDAVISGRFEGCLTVTGRLNLRSTARIFGEIRYGQMEVEAGALIEGQLLPQPVAEMVARAPKAEKKAALAVVSAPEEKVPDNVAPLFSTTPVEDDGDDEDTVSSREKPGTYRRGGQFA